MKRNPFISVHRSHLFCMAFFWFGWVLTSFGQKEVPEREGMEYMVWVGDSILVLDTEVTLAGYMEFVIFGPNAPELTFPFSNSIARDFFMGEGKTKEREFQGITATYDHMVFVNNPSEHMWPFCMNSPVTGITYEQAMLLCQWRTSSDSLFSVKNKMPYRLVFDLIPPALFDQLTNPKDSIDKKGEPAFNFKGAAYRKLYKKNWNRLPTKLLGNGAMPRGAFDSNALKLYDMQGNVAEMTSVKGIAKGGGYQFPARDSYPGKENRYTKPEVWLGFRIMARKVAL